MLVQWYWVALGGMAILVVYGQFRIYRIRRESKKREELFQIVTENAADMIALVDVKGHRLYNSPAYKRILGYSAAELGETSAFEQIHPDDRFRVLEAGREARATGVGKKLEYRIRHKDGTWRVLESVAGTIRDAKGDVIKLVITNRDVTERKQAEEQARHNSFHDVLTGLPNRRLFLDRLKHLFECAQREPGRQYAVLLVDLDAFRIFNDNLGSGAGDQLIVEVSHRLEACVRGEDTISRAQEDLSARNAVLSRMGGDEFAVLLEGVSDPSNALRVAQRMLSAIAEPFIMEGREVGCTSASIGIALSITAEGRAENLLQEADVAMRRAKALGGSRCEVFDEAMHLSASNRLKLESELREALVKHQFRVYYQPIVQLETRQITGLEALLRWQHPEKGLISPYQFIDAAEDTGLLLCVRQWLILEVCRQLQSWGSENPTIEPVTVSVNLSAKQFIDPRLVTELQEAVRKTGIELSRLQLEITESVAAADPKHTVALLSSLKHLGIGAILDDFGSGNSSLSGLCQFPVQALKIDRSLIGAMLTDRGTCATIELIILVAHKLKLKAIAEGIESAKHWERLRKLGCDLGQGYFFSQPVEPKVAGTLLRESGSLTHAKAAGG
jgi:diguanylate cyclase (GGDEF)-like protein/PAS domain S-box-containing protein